MWRQAIVAHRMWEISSHTTRNWLIQATIMRRQPCNYRKKEDCPSEGKCRIENIIYQCIVSTSGHPDKVYLGTAEGDFKKTLISIYYPTIKLIIDIPFNTFRIIA